MSLYFNNASTTPPDHEVIEDFVWCAKHCWQNPSDISEDGMKVKRMIATAQKQVADVINAKPEEIIFTSGATEANNWAIKGFLDRNDWYYMISTKIEHPSVNNVGIFLLNNYDVDYVGTDEYGMVDLDELKKIMYEKQKYYEKPFVSIILANNEIGTVQPIKKIAEMVHKYDGVLHVDATQAFMHMQIDVKDMGIDMMSTSFHKYGGLKGGGFLYVKNGVLLSPLIHGGHQFNSMRPGTENVPMIYAIGNQVERLNKNLSKSIKKTKQIYNYIIKSVYEKCDGLCKIQLNGDPQHRLPNIVSLTFEGITAESLIILLEQRGIYVSAGSACCAGENTPSRVLKAIGKTDDEARSTIRISITDKTTFEDVDVLVAALIECIGMLKKFG